MLKIQYLPTQARVKRFENWRVLSVILLEQTLLASRRDALLLGRYKQQGSSGLEIWWSAMLWLNHQPENISSGPQRPSSHYTVSDRLRPMCPIYVKYFTWPQQLLWQAPSLLFLTLIIKLNLSSKKMFFSLLMGVNANKFFHSFISTVKRSMVTFCTVIEQSHYVDINVLFPQCQMYVFIPVMSIMSA